MHVLCIDAVFGKIARWERTADEFVLSGERETGNQRRRCTKGWDRRMKCLKQRD